VGEATVSPKWLELVLNLDHQLFATPEHHAARQLPFRSSLSTLICRARIRAHLVAFLVVPVIRVLRRLALVGALPLFSLAALPLLPGCALMRATGDFLQSTAPAPASQVVPVSSVPFRLALIAGDLALLDQQRSTVLVPPPWPQTRWDCLTAQPHADRVAQQLLGHLVLTTELAPNMPFRGTLTVRDSLDRPVRWTTPTVGRTFVNDQQVTGGAVHTGTGTVLRLAGPILRADDFPVCTSVGSRK
jgi:hypothetical protein